MATSGKLDRITITIQKDLLLEVKKTTKNLSKFFSQAVEEKVREERKKNMIKTLKGIKRVEPKTPLSTNELIRKGRDEELF